MINRTQSLLNLRPEILNARIDSNMTGEERFQNATLRPVIKFQNDLLLAVFLNYLVKHKTVFEEYSSAKRLLYIENAIQKDIKLRNSMKGIIIGQFTCEEYAAYICNSSSLNKRMMQMVIERLKDQLQLLGAEASI